MKQFKVIADKYNEASGGMISVNFNEVVQVAPNSKIVLDKFSCEMITDTSGKIRLDENQIIQYSPQNTQTVSNQPIRNVVIPSGTYNFNNNVSIGATFNQLLDTIAEKLNGSLNGNPQISTLLTSPTADLGFGFKCFTSSKALTYIQCYQTNTITSGPSSGGAPPPSVPPTYSNMTLSNSSAYQATSTGNYWLTCAKPLINGCLQGNMQIKVGSNNWIVGLAPVPATQTTAPTIQFGLGFDNNTGNCYFINGSTQTTAPFTKTNLDNLTSSGVYATYSFYSANGGLHLQIIRPAGTVYFDSQTDGFSDVFAGFLFRNVYQLSVSGTFTSSTKSSFSFIRLTEQPNLTLDNIGYFEDIPVNTKTYITTNGLGAIRGRTIFISFKESPELNNGLGFLSNTLSGNSDATSGVLLFTSDNTINFSSYLDLAISVLNLPLQTYEARSSGLDNGRKNILCYFTPNRVSTNSNVYYFENKQKIFLSIGNKEPLNFSSLVFRVYNPSNKNLPVDADYLSFNIYIADKDE